MGLGRVTIWCRVVREGLPTVKGVDDRREQGLCLVGEEHSRQREPAGVGGVAPAWQRMERHEPGGSGHSRGAWQGLAATRLAHSRAGRGRAF